MTKHLTGTREEWLTARLRLLEAEHGAPAAVDWLSFAAAPTFAIMAFVTEVHGGGPLEALCSAGSGGSSMGGMTVMYALMSAFHTPPWLRLLARRRRTADPSRPEFAGQELLTGAD